MAQVAYDNPGGTGTGGVYVPEVWSKDILLALQAKTFMPDLVVRYDTNVTDSGDKIHVPRIASRTAGTRGSVSVIAFTGVTETEFTLDITTEAIDAFEIRDLLKVQANYDLRQKFTVESGKAVARKMDADMLGHVTAHTLITQTIGSTASTTTRIAATYLSRAMLKLDAANADDTDRYLIVEAYGKAQVIEVDNFIRWDATGKGDSPIITGKVGTYYGLNVMLNNNLPAAVTTAILAGFAFQKNALAMAIQKNISNTAQYDINSDSTKVLVKAIYGYGVAFTNAVVQMYYGTSGM